MAVINKVEFVAQQLRLIAPDAEWTIFDIDRATELARILVRAGITDLWALKFIPVSETYLRPEYIAGTEAGDILMPAVEETVKGYAFEYYGRRVGYLGTPDRVQNDLMFQYSDVGYMIAWSAEGHGQVAYVVSPNKAKTGLEIKPIWRTSSEAADARMVIIAAISFFCFYAMPLAGVSVGNAIGTAVLPASVSAAYPAVATAIGNVAISAALNGGDIKAAVTNVATSIAAQMVGFNAGSFVEGIAGNEFLGALTEVATRTALVGGDIKKAVAIFAAERGLNMIGSSDSSGFDFFAGFDGGDSFTQDPFSGNARDLDFTTGQFDFDNYTFPVLEFDGGFGFETGPVTLPGADDVFTFNPFLGPDAGAAADAAVAPDVRPPVTPPVAAQPNSAAFNPATIVQTITSSAMAALNLVKAYRSLDTPAIQQTARVVRPNGAVSVVSDNGLIQTRTPAGQITAQRPPVGVPQATLNGNYIVNNGDGTYSVVDPAGQTVRYSYGANAPGGGLLEGVSPLMLAAGAGALFLIMKRKG